MRRKDREVTDIDEVNEIISSCDILRIGLSDGEYPYIVPLNFGFEKNDNSFVFYVHGSVVGRKAELMRKNKKCTIEIDRLEKIKTVGEKSATSLYSSFMAEAEAEELQGEEKIKGLQLLLDRYPETKKMDARECNSNHVVCYRLKTLNWSCKRNK